jgi:putative spermidine/putrescine transport system substrate-binding protein
VIYATDSTGRKLHDGPSDWLTGLPTVTSGDTLGIRLDLTGRPISSWSDLLSSDFKGRAALQEQPTIGDDGHGAGYGSHG